MFYLQSSPGISPCKPISHLSFQSVEVVWPKHLGFPNKSLPLLKLALNGTWRCTIPGFQSLVTRDFLVLGRWPPPEQLELLFQCWPGWSILRATWVMFYVQEKLGHDALPELTCRNTNHRHFQIHDIFDLLTVSMLVVWGTRVKIYETSFALKVEDHSVPQLNLNTAQPTQHDTPFHCTLTCCAIQLCGYTLKIQCDKLDPPKTIVLQKRLVFLCRTKSINCWKPQKMTGSRSKLHWGQKRFT